MTGIPSRVERHLCVIFAADVAGYSRLMRSDEEGTLAQLVTARQKMDELVAAHGGRIVNSVGDSVLAEFTSVMDAMRSAIEIQRSLDVAAAGVVPEKRVLFRIGLQLGEVMVRSTDIYGDGVNVAARLQTLADPGGIVVSGTIYEQLRDRLPITFTELGEQAVRNIDRPVPAFAVTAEAIANAPGFARVRSPPRPQRLRLMYLVAGTAAIALCSVLWFSWRSAVAEKTALRPEQQDTATLARGALLPMSLVIAPLRAPLADAMAERFADELRRDLITGASNVGKATVLRFPTDNESGSANDARASARRVGAHYVVEGDVRRQGNANTVNLRLIDTETGVQTWSAQYAFKESDDLPKTARAKRIVVEDLLQSVWTAETKRVLALPIDRLSPTELVLRGRSVVNQAMTLKNALEAQKLFAAALAADPNNVMALKDSIRLLDLLVDLDPSVDRDRIAREMDELATRALRLDPASAEVLQLRAVSLYYFGRWNAAIEAIDQAIKRDPYEPSYYTDKALAKILSGRPAEGLALIDSALALNPPNPSNELAVQCFALLLLGQAERATQVCEKAGGVGDFWLLQAYLVALYANNGETNKAAAAKRELERILPHFTIAHVKLFSDAPEFVRLAETHWFAGLRKAGVPEQ